MVNTVERNIGAILEEALETVEKNFLAWITYDYDEDDKESVVREIELRSLVYTSLTNLGEVIKNTSVEFKEVNSRYEALLYRANGYLKRAVEAEKKTKRLALEKERLEKEVNKLRARVNTSPNPFVIRVDRLGTDPDASRYIIRAAELQLNALLRVKGFVTLSDVYEELGLDEPTNNNVSKVCGWKNITSDAIRFEVYKHETENSFIVVVNDCGPIL